LVSKKHGAWSKELRAQSMEQRVRAKGIEHAAMSEEILKKQ
jgi:hypothetical protein